MQTDIAGGKPAVYATPVYSQGIFPHYIFCLL